MNLIKLENGRRYPAIKYDGTNLVEVLAWGEGQIVGEGTSLSVYNPKDLNCNCLIGQWLMKNGDFIFSYDSEEIVDKFIWESDKIEITKDYLRSSYEKYYEVVKSIYDEFYWRYHKYIHDKFIAELVFSHYISAIKFIGLPENIEDQVIEVFKLSVNAKFS